MKWKQISLLSLTLTLLSLQGFFSRETNFYFCQFLSNFFKYLFSNLPLSHPYNIFAIYFPDNSPLINVVATTRRNGTHSMLTSAKLTEGYLVVGITRELDKEPSLHCYLIYISYRWSILQQYVYLMSTPQWLCKTVHPTLMSMYPTCGSNVVYMLPDIII